MRLSILILTTANRQNYLSRLTGELNAQINENYAYNNIEIMTHGGIETIGEKRNILLQGCKGEYVVFIDDDDFVSADYILSVLDGLDNGPDCLSLRGIMTTDGENPEVFEHSIRYKEWKDNGTAYPNVRYERFPNHLNVIRADIAKQFKFPEKNHGEDFAWSKALHESGLLKNEFFIDKVLYYYKYRTMK